MKKRFSWIVLLISICLIVPVMGSTLKGDQIEKIRLQLDDIPEGFMYGSIPPFAKKVLKNNPWKFDKSAIKLLASQIYPNGNASQISEMHMTILTRKDKPYDDDIVCYIIKYKNNTSYKKELQKITDYVGYNKDRAIVFSHENIVVFLHVDDTQDFHFIEALSMKMKQRMN